MNKGQGSPTPLSLSLSFEFLPKRGPGMTRLRIVDRRVLCNRPGTNIRVPMHCMKRTNVRSSYSYYYSYYTQHSKQTHTPPVAQGKKRKLRLKHLGGDCTIVQYNNLYTSSSTSMHISSSSSTTQDAEKQVNQEYERGWDMHDLAFSFSLPPPAIDS